MQIVWYIHPELEVPLVFYIKLMGSIDKNGEVKKYIF